MLVDEWVDNWGELIDTVPDFDGLPNFYSESGLEFFVDP
jgi:hypothetical protein